jgi:hypothetical protein
MGTSIGGDPRLRRRTEDIRRDILLLGGIRGGSGRFAILPAEERTFS